MFRVLLKKEIMEQVRTHRLLIMAAVLILAGTGSPLIAKLTPEMVKRLSEGQEGVVISLPPPTLADGLAQYIKNLSQFGVMLVILLGMASVSGEKSRGTAVFTLSRPVRRGTFLLAKFSAQSLLFLGCLAGAALGCYLYSGALFEAPEAGPFLLLTALLGLFILVFMAMTLLASTVTRTVTASAGAAFTGMVILIVLGNLPVIGRFMPNALLAWAGGLARGDGAPGFAAAGISLALIAAFLGLASLSFSREEI